MANEPGGTKFAQLITEIDLDRSKYDKGLDDITANSEVAVVKVEKQWKALGIKTDAFWESQRQVAIKNYQKILAEGQHTANELINIEQAKASKIEAINVKQYSALNSLIKAREQAYESLGIRSAQVIAMEMSATFAWYAKAKEQAGSNANELLRIEEAKNAKIIALENEIGAVRIANNAKIAASAKATANAEIAAVEKANAANAEYWMAKMNFEKQQMTKSQNDQAGYWLARMKYEKGIKDNIAVNDDEHWKNMGVRSNAQIEMQKKQVLDSYSTLREGAKGHHYEQLRLEEAKNKQLRKLNDEMVGHTSITWASMTRSLLRFYAAYYVISSGVSTISNLFMGGVNAIDDLKTNTIAVASIITTMQGTTGNVVENYRMNLVYAEALNKKLMEIDANTSANYDQLQLMNRAAISNGVRFDINNQKQIESFTAISNTVAFLTKGQNQEMQYSQEINALMKGEVNSKNRVAQMIDNIIKQEGKYKGGLEEVIKLGKEHSDTWERLLPYFVGINAASSDIAKTWAAVSSSLQTAWGIIQRGLFAGVYDTLTTEGQKATQWMKKNADDIVSVIYKIKDTAIFAVEATIFAMGLFSAAVMLYTGRAADAGAWFALRWEAMTTRVNVATSKMALGFSVFTGAILGFSIGSYLSSQFEWARVSGVAMTYGLIDAWRNVELAFSRASIRLSLDSPKDKAAKMTALYAEYDAEKKQRDLWRDEQFKDVSDEAIKEAKAKAEAAAKVKIPDFGKGTPDAEKETEIRRNKLAEATADNKQYYEDAISQSDHWLKMQKIAKDTDIEETQQAITDKKVALNSWYDAQAISLETYLKGDTKLAAELAKLWKDYSKEWNKLDREQVETAAKQEADLRKAEEKRLDGYDEGWKKFYELKGKEGDAQKKGSEEYRKLTADEYDFAATENERQINKIIHDEQEKLRKLKILYDQSQVQVEYGTDFMSFKQYEDLKAQIRANTTKAIRESDIKLLSDKMNYYNSVTGYGSESYRIRLFQIEQEKQKIIETTHDERLALEYVAEKSNAAFVDMARGSKNFFAGVRAGFVTLANDTVTWGKIGLAVGSTFKTSLGTEIGNIFYDLLTGNFEGFKSYGVKVADAVLKEYTSQLGKMSANYITDLMKPGWDVFASSLGGVWDFISGSYKGMAEGCGRISIIEYLKPAWDTVSDLFSNQDGTGVWDVIKFGAQSAWSAISGIDWAGIGTTIAGAFSRITDAFSGENITMTFETVWKAADAVWQYGAKVLGGLFEYAGSAIDWEGLLDIGIGGNYSGGLIQGMASGGDSPANDTVLSMLSPGEYVVPRSAVNSDSLEMLEYIRMNKKPPGYANGGLVADNPIDYWLTYYGGGSQLTPSIINAGQAYVSTPEYQEEVAYQKAYQNLMWSLQSHGPDSEYQGEYYSSPDYPINPFLYAGQQEGPYYASYWRDGSVTRRLNDDSASFLESLIPSLTKGILAALPGVGPYAAAAMSAIETGAKGGNLQQVITNAATSYIAALVASKSFGSGTDVSGVGMGGVGEAATQFTTEQIAQGLVEKLIVKEISKLALGYVLGGDGGSSTGLIPSSAMGVNYSADDHGLFTSLYSGMGEIAPQSWGTPARDGIDYVPYDNMPIRAHKKEAVLTAEDAEEWRAGKGGGGSFGPITINLVTDGGILATAVATEFERNPRLVRRALNG
jgi:hypothetical protein